MWIKKVLFKKYEIVLMWKTKLKCGKVGRVLKKAYNFVEKYVEKFKRYFLDYLIFL